MDLKLTLSLILSNMNENKNKTLLMILNIVKYVVTALIGAFGASNVEQVSNLLTM